MIAVHLENQAVSVVKKPAPRVPQGYARLKLVAGGICNTDIELMRGYYGFKGTPGHEFVGEVEECADSSWVGKRVVGEINFACGKCEWCARGLGRHCPNRTVLGIVNQPGAFSERFNVPMVNLLEVPRKVATDHAVFTEPIAAACEILEQVKIPKGEKTAVLGDGKLGLLIAQVLSASGAEVHLYGRHRNKIEIAEAAGVHGHLASEAPRAAYRYTVDATGSAEGLSQAVSMTQPRGYLILKSTVHGKVAIDTAPIIVDEITLVGSRCGRFEPALKLLSSGKLNLQPMISAEYPLADAPRAFAHAQERGILKVLLRNA